MFTVKGNKNMNRRRVIVIVRSGEVHRLPFEKIEGMDGEPTYEGLESKIRTKLQMGDANFLLRWKNEGGVPTTVDSDETFQVALQVQKTRKGPPRFRVVDHATEEFPPKMTRGCGDKGGRQAVLRIGHNGVMRKLPAVATLAALHQMLAEKLPELALSPDSAASVFDASGYQLRWKNEEERPSQVKSEEDFAKAMQVMRARKNGAPRFRVVLPRKKSLAGPIVSPPHRAALKSDVFGAGESEGAVPTADDGITTEHTKKQKQQEKNSRKKSMPAVLRIAHNGVVHKLPAVTTLSALRQLLSEQLPELGLGATDDKDAGTEESSFQLRWTNEEERPAEVKSEEDFAKALEVMKARKNGAPRFRVVSTATAAVSPQRNAWILMERANTTGAATVVIPSDEMATVSAAAVSASPSARPGRTLRGPFEGCLPDFPNKKNGRFAFATLEEAIVAAQGNPKFRGITKVASGQYTLRRGHQLLPPTAATEGEVSWLLLPPQSHPPQLQPTAAVLETKEMNAKQRRLQLQKMAKMNMKHQKQQQKELNKAQRQQVKAMRQKLDATATTVGGLETASSDLRIAEVVDI